MEIKRHTLHCTCGSPRHHLFVSYWLPADDDLNAVFITVKLNPVRFVKRIWRGIKFIFGFKSDYGEYGEIVLGKSDLDEYIEFLKDARAELYNDKD